MDHPSLEERLAAEKEVGGEIVKFSGLKVEGFGDKADLDFGVGVLLLAEESEKSAEVEGGVVANDGSVLRELGNFTGIGDGVLQISRGID